MIAQHSSASNEHYTPEPIVEAARLTLGSIDLDPASCSVANERVRATGFMSLADDGLAREWAGRVFLNPPGGVLRRDTSGAWRPGQGVGRKSSAHVWWTRLVVEYAAGRVTAAVFVGFTLEILRVHQGSAWPGAPVVPVQSFHRCYPRSRLHFRGARPTHANVIAFLPPRDDTEAYARFAENFSPFGLCERGSP